MTDNKIGSGTSAGLVEYLDRLVEKGRATPGAITPLKTAFTKVVESVDGKEWPMTEVSTIGVEDYISRFANLTRGAYTDKTISVYKSRMNRVIVWYLKFMDQPGWMPLISARGARKSTKTISKSDSTINDDTATNGSMEDATSQGANERFEIVIGDGRKGLLIFPSNRTDADVDKLQKLVDFLRSTATGGENEQAPGA